MPDQFITNQEVLLNDVINNILPHTEKVKFLVGYFYFSGIKGMYENLEDKDMRILVGMEVEHGLGKKIKQFHIISEQEGYQSNNLIREAYNTSLKNLINETDYFDNEQQREALILFFKKIQNGTLEIRKTREPNHAKMYIFESREELRDAFPGAVITGSSNLTAAGMKNRFEINTIFRDNSTIEEANHIFNQLWNDAVPIVNKNDSDDFYNEVIKKVWVEKLPKPYIVFIRVLDEYFPEDKEEIKLPASITDDKFINLQYQIEAIKRAMKIIERHNGVIIADVVGLGKSIIGSAVAHNLRVKTIIISPPHLIDQWEEYRLEFDVNAKVYSSGKIEDAYNDFFHDEKEKLIIIDEAHKYRNEYTTNYGLLHKLCQGNKIMLLTATPFNNKPSDIFSMIKLFQVPGKTTIQTIDNLLYRFKELIKEHKEIDKFRKEKKHIKDPDIQAKIKKFGDKIRNILSPVLIRRSRIDLEGIKRFKQDLDRKGIFFPEVKDPEELDYDLGKLSDLYLKTLETISPANDFENKKGFLGTRYKPVSYLKNIEKYRKKITEEFGDINMFIRSQINIAIFMRRLLVRRFESSVNAFKLSLEALIRSSENMLYWYDKLDKIPIYKKGNLPDPEDLMRSIDGALSDELQEELFEDQLAKYKEKGLQIIPKNEIKVEFQKDLIRDIELLKNIHKEWFADGIKNDPKLESFKKIIKQQIKNDKEDRKIVVFTEFTDTLEYLYENLNNDNELRVFKYSSKDASKQNKQIIKRNFDASVTEHARQNDYDILLATDAISEGYNLNRAGTVFNYDIPYNPVRVIQRVGRINRINIKKFDELYIYNFFPTATGEKETGTKAISTLKIAIISALLGSDTKVLTSDEEIGSHFLNQIKQALKESEKEESWDVKYDNIINTLRENDNHGILKAAKELPRRTKIGRKTDDDKEGVIICAKKGEECIFKFAFNKDENITSSAEEAIKTFDTDINESPLKLSKKFEEIYQYLKQNIFNKKTQVSLDKGERESIAILNAVKNKFFEYKNYCEDLITIIRNYGAFPEIYARELRAVEVSKEGIKTLMNNVPQKYLSKIFKKINKINDKEEILILAEELQ